MEEENWMRKAFNRQVEAIKKSAEDFSDASKWFASLSVDEQELLIASGRDIFTEYQIWKGGGGLKDLLTTPQE